MTADRLEYFNTTRMAKFADICNKLTDLVLLSESADVSKVREKARRIYDAVRNVADDTSSDFSACIATLKGYEREARKEQIRLEIARLEYELNQLKLELE